MDIKSKSIRYSTGTKALAVVLVWLFFMSAAICSGFMIYNQNVVTSESYFDTDSFKWQFSELISDVIELNVKLKSVANIKSTETNKEMTDAKLERFNTINSKLSSNINFVYYIVNTHSGENYTNISEPYPAMWIRKQAAVVHYNQSTASYKFPLDGNIAEMLNGTAYEVYAAIQQPLKQGDSFYKEFTTYTNLKAFTTYTALILVLSLVLMFVSFIYLVSVAGRQERGGAVVLSPIDRIYSDIHTLLVLIAAVISVSLVANIPCNYGRIEFIIAASIVLSIDVFIGLCYVLSIIRQFKNGTVLKNTLIYAGCGALIRLSRLCFNGKLFKGWTLLLLFGYGMVNGILFALGTHIHRDYQIPIVFIIFLAFNTASLYFAAKSLLSLSQIMVGVKEISTGNIDYKLNTSEMSAAFSGFAQDIRGIQGGLRNAVAEAVKGERMKTDLIANVSHDLKTPLTSIINYVDLLKREETDNSRASEYIEILEEKASRLKQLIEDLIEASKASSGSIMVNCEKVDLHQLVLQACGEYEEKIGSAGLDVRISSADKNTLVLADGKHMWRILENLLSNTVKYSMPSSRVYISTAQDGNYGVLTMKNVSAFPLDIPPEQLIERFVRGDAARTTEGSGLGLSIAQSLTELQGGKFKLEIDGDLFKVIVEIPIAEEV